MCVGGGGDTEDDEDDEDDDDNDDSEAAYYKSDVNFPRPETGTPPYLCCQMVGAGLEAR